MAKYVYPAIFTYEASGGYSVRFPDVKGCFTEGSDLADALEMAQDALCLMLYNREESGDEIPAPTDIKKIETGAGDFVSLVHCDTLEYRKMYKNNAIKKTLTIPAWLNTIAEKENINFSQVLQDALRAKLNVG